MNLREISRAGKCYLAYRWGKPIPFSAYFRITYRCNEQCDHCMIRLRKSKELTLRQIRGLFDQLKDAGIVYLTISGGEPLLHEDFSGVMRALEDYPFITSLNTNGTLISDKNARLIAESFSSIRISLDGSGAAHDRRRGNGMHDLTLEGIRLLKSHGATVFAHLAVGPDNEDEIKSLVRQATPFVDGISIMPILSLKNKKRIRHEFSKEFLDMIPKHKRNQIKAIHDPRRSRITPEGCDAGVLYFQILPNGDLTPCPNIFETIMGNACEGKLKDHLGPGLWIERCQGCNTRCTKEISSLMRKSPLELLRLFPKMIRRYKL